jgi:hypothetical protein
MHAVRAHRARYELLIATPAGQPFVTGYPPVPTTDSRAPGGVMSS